MITLLTEDQQELIDIHMDFFHPEEYLFSKEVKENHMLEALKVFAQAYGSNGEPTSDQTVKLRELWLAKDSEAMYEFLDQHID